MWEKRFLIFTLSYQHDNFLNWPSVLQTLLIENIAVHLLFYLIYSIILSLSHFFSLKTHNPSLIALHTKTLYLILAAFVCLNNFSLWKREDRTSYSIQDTSWSWFYIEEKLCQLFCYWCVLCCSYDLQLSLSTTWHSANHNNSECLSKIFIPHLWTHGCVKIIRIMLSCIYFFSFISTEFCLPFYVWPLKITSSVHPFVVSVSFCHFEEFCGISKLCHLVKLLLFQIICNCDEKCGSYEASLLISIGNFFSSWKLFNYPYTILPIFQLGLGFSPEIQLILDAVDKKFTQDFRSSDAKELNWVVLFQRKAISLTSQTAEAEQQIEPTSSVWSCLLFAPLLLNTVRTRLYWAQTCITNISQRKGAGMQTSKQPPVRVTSHCSTTWLSILMFLHRCPEYQKTIDNLHSMS